MKYPLLAIGLVACTLSACTVKVNTRVNQNRWMRKEVSEAKLDNGKKLMIGYHKPVKANGCVQVGKEEKNWAQIKFKEQFKPHIALGNPGYWGIKQIALAYANKHPAVNYVYMLIPNTTSVMGFETNTSADAILRYYSCKNPPKKHSNL